MLHVRKRNRQKYSEACRPILGKHTDGWAGRIIDLLAVFALLAGTATTFSVATPLMASIINSLFGVEISRTVLTIIILLITIIYLAFSKDKTYTLKIPSNESQPDFTDVKILSKAADS